MIPIEDYDSSGVVRIFELIYSELQRAMTESRFAGENYFPFFRCVFMCNGSSSESFQLWFKPNM